MTLIKIKKMKRKKNHPSAHEEERRSSFAHQVVLELLYAERNRILLSDNYAEFYDAVRLDYIEHYIDNIWKIAPTIY